VLANENESIVPSYSDHKKQIEQTFYEFIFSHTSSTLFWRKWTVLHEKFFKEISTPSPSSSETHDVAQMASAFLKKRAGLLTTMEQILKQSTHAFPMSKEGSSPLRQFVQLIQSHDGFVSSLLNGLRNALSEELRGLHNTRKVTKSYEKTQFYVQGGSV
jgi:hypothetical protein